MGNVLGAGLGPGGVLAVWGGFAAAQGVIRQRCLAEGLDRGFEHVKIIVSGGLTPDRIGYFKDAGAPVDYFAVGSYISGATPIDFTGDLKEIDGRAIAKRGRIPGVTPSPRLSEIDLRDWLPGSP